MDRWFIEQIERVPVKSLAKAICILLAFSENQAELGVTGISTSLDLPKSTVHNILKTFEAYELVERNPATEKYRLGLRLFELGNLVRRNMELRQVALPYMEELVELSNETVHLTVCRDGEVVYIESAQPKGSIVTMPVTGRRAPLHCTGVGKAILAFLPGEEVEKVIAAGLKRFTPNTITDPHLLMEHLVTVRRLGYAIDNMEHEHGIRCVAVPIRNEAGAVFASMSISGPSPRFLQENVERYAAALLSASEAISQRLGYHRPAWERARKNERTWEENRS